MGDKDSLENYISCNNYALICERMLTYLIIDYHISKYLFTSSGLQIFQQGQKMCQDYTMSHPPLCSQEKQALILWS